MCRPRRCNACCIPKFHDIQNYLKETSLTPMQKLLLQNRYINLLNHYEHRALFYTWLYNTFQIIVTVGGVVVPALLSIQYLQDTRDIFWATWCLSVVMGICTTLFTLLKIDRRYYMINTAKEVMSSDIYQFLGLTGKYATVKRPGQPKKPATHEALIQYLFYSLEKLWLTQVQQEYIQFNNSDKKKEQTDTLDPVQNAIAHLGGSPAQPLGSGNGATGITPQELLAGMMRTNSGDQLMKGRDNQTANIKETIKGTNKDGIERVTSGSERFQNSKNLAISLRQQRAALRKRTRSMGDNIDDKGKLPHPPSPQVISTINMNVGHEQRNQDENAMVDIEGIAVDYNSDSDKSTSSHVSHKAQAYFAD